MNLNIHCFIIVEGGGIDDDILRAFQRGAFIHVEKSMENYTKVCLSGDRSLFPN
jgi:hypothetical protein